MSEKKKVSNKMVFWTEDKDGKPLELAVKRPDAKEQKDLQKVYNIAFSEALESRAPLRAKVEAIARAQKIWDDEKEAEYRKLQKEINACEIKLAGGGKSGLTKNTGRDLAIKIRELRATITDLMAERNAIDANTVENQAEAIKFGHAIAVCTVNPNTGDKFFKSYEDYLERQSEKAAMDSAKNLALLSYQLDPNYEASLPENKFLKEYGFADDKLRLIDKKGRLVDAKGRLIREDGRFINEKNELIDTEGNLVDEQGNYKVDFAPFLDDVAEEKE